MIISHRHRYMFEERPRTDSRAAHRKLRELYDAAAMLDKRSTSRPPAPACRMIGLLGTHRPGFRHRS